MQYQASTDTWQFAEHQYDMIGADNTYIASNYSGWIDLFGWATNGNEESGNTHFQPWDSSTEDTYGNSMGGGVNMNAASDWGRNMGSDWRTLTEVEWDYLLDTRASGATVKGVTNARYTHLAITINAVTITGLLLFPNGYNQGTPDGVTWAAEHINQHETGYTATCTTAGWLALEAAGCVFLPYAGQREGTTVGNVGSVGYYWVATTRIGTTAVALHIPSTNDLFGYPRHMGYSVRLVYVVE